MPKPAPTPEPKPLPKPPPVTPTDGNAVMVVGLEDPLMKPMLASDGGLQIVSLDAEASRKFKKSTILGQSRAVGEVEHQAATVNLYCQRVDQEVWCDGVHGYEPFPAKSPEIHQFLFGSSNLLIPLFI